jgi:hypothetical protein
VLHEYFNVDKGGNIITNGNIEDIANDYASKYNQTHKRKINASQILGSLVGDYNGVGKKGTSGLIKLLS